MYSSQKKQFQQIDGNRNQTGIKEWGNREHECRLWWEVGAGEDASKSLVSLSVLWLAWLHWCWVLCVCVCVCVCVYVLCVLDAQSCLTLCNPMDYSLPGSSVHGILQAKMLEWVAILFSRGSSWPRGWTWVSCIADRFFAVWATREADARFYIYII